MELSWARRPEYLEGRLAFREGKTKADCPYGRKQREARILWLFGYDEQKTETLREKEREYALHQTEADFVIAASQLGLERAQKILDDLKEQE